MKKIVKCDICGNIEEGFIDNNGKFICKGCIVENSKEFSELKKMCKFDFEIY